MKPKTRKLRWQRTVAQQQLPIKILLMNDGRQQMVHVWQKLFFDGRFVATDNHNPDFVMLAKSYGFESFSCATAEDLPGAIERLIACEGPVLADFRVLPDICLPMVAPGKALDDMILPGELSLDEGTPAPKFEGAAPS